MRRMEAIMTCRERLELNVAPLLAVEELALALLPPNRRPPTRRIRDWGTFCTAGGAKPTPLTRSRERWGRRGCRDGGTAPAAPLEHFSYLRGDLAGAAG